jgi:hypothetical protein
MDDTHQPTMVRACVCVNTYNKLSRIDTNCNVATTFGRVSQEKNKYQGGTLARDGVIYAIPSNANDILCIDTNQVHVAAKNDKLNNEIEYFAQDAAFTIGDIYALTETKRKDKWQGKMGFGNIVVMLHII